MDKDSLDLKEPKLQVTPKIMKIKKKKMRKMRKMRKRRKKTQFLIV